MVGAKGAYEAGEMAFAEAESPEENGLPQQMHVSAADTVDQQVNPAGAMCMHVA